MPITINGYSTMAIVDTAAQATIMSDRLASKLSTPLRYESKYLLKGPDEGSSFSARFCDFVEIGLGQHTYNWRLFVAPIQDDFILGLDFLIHFGIDVKLSEKCLTLGRETIPVNVEDKQDEGFHITRILAEKTVKIRPRCGINVMISFPSNSNDAPLLFEPLERGNVFILDSLVPSGKSVPITI